MSKPFLPPLSFTVPSDPELAAPRARPGGYLWPTPPYAVYPPGEAHDGAMAVEVEGLNGKIMQAHLSLFAPADNLVQVLLPPARTPVPLHLHQFRRLTLLEPLSPSFVSRGALPGELMDFHPALRFTVELSDGSRLAGRTIGHVENEYGLFLFPPIDDRGTVQRMFCPRAVYARASFGPGLGEVLIAQDSATPAQIASALAQQNQLREQRVGDVLRHQAVVTPEQLEIALLAQSKMPMVRIGEALIALGFANQAQLDTALAEQRDNRSVPLGELLVRAGYVQREQLRTALARKMGYPLVQVDSYPIDLVALKQVPLSVARRLGVLPLQALPGRLVVAIDDPSRRDVLDELEFMAQGKVVPVLPASDNLASLIAPTYQRFGLEDSQNLGLLETGGFNFDEGGADRLLADLEQTHQADGGGHDESTIEQSDSALVRLINTMIVDAHTQGASDIHIETQPGREKLRIRFRRDGMLSLYAELPHTYRSAFIARVKIMCDLDISERRRPQDGKINFARFVPGCAVELRVATIPTSHGLEDAVLRILSSAKAIPLDQLGMSPANLAALKTAIHRPYGLVLCVGPTGSGKTTTLHSALSQINLPDRKIWTAEDPVEITQAGLRQVQVNPKIDWTFAKALRAFLRADPDVIMVGEIRDQETARMAVESSLTGHLVLSTLHTNSAAETVTRLLDMGMDPFTFADALVAVVAQRLLRRLCPQCRQSTPMADAVQDELLDDYLHAWDGQTDAPERSVLLSDWLGRFGVAGRLMHFHSPGCAHCDHSGRRGRLGIHELLSISRAQRKLIQTGANADQIQQQGLREGLRTLRQDGIEKVLAGLSTLEEVRATSNA